MTDQTEYVYLIGSRESRLVKIGRSTNIGKRLADLQRMSPVPLAVLWSVEGGAELEASLHRRFKAYRSHGEWFGLPGEDARVLVAAAVREIEAETQRVREERHRACRMGKVRRVFHLPATTGIRSFESRMCALEERVEELEKTAGFRIGEVVSIRHPNWSGPKTGVIEFAGRSDKYIFTVCPNDGQDHRFLNIFMLSDIVHQTEIVELPRLGTCELGCYCESVRLHNYACGIWKEDAQPAVSRG